MTIGNETWQGETQATAETPREVSPGYLMVLGQKSETLYFPQLGFDRSFYITARPTLLDEDKISQEAVVLKWEQAAPVAQNRAQRRHGGGEAAAPMQMQAAVSPNRAFVAKCAAQITDFRFPVIEQGERTPTIRKYNEANGGDNAANREIYETFLARGMEELRDLIEQFLDFVAGRGTDAQADFEAFLAAQPQLLAGS